MTDRVTDSLIFELNNLLPSTSDEFVSSCRDTIITLRTMSEKEFTGDAIIDQIGRQITINSYIMLTLYSLSKYREEWDTIIEWWNSGAYARLESDLEDEE